MNKKFLKILLYYFMIMIAANLIHPITPEFIKVKHFPDYMFGVALAMMNLTNFLFSNFWGYVIDKIGRKKVMIIGLLGYAIGQLGFGYSNSIGILIVVRLISGFFTGAFNVPILAYIADISTPEELKKYFSIYVTSTALAGAIGYYIGGVVGTYSLINTFYLQVTILVIASLCIYFTVSETKQFNNEINISEMFKSLNPFQIFYRSTISKVVSIMLITSFFIYFANTMFDNSFSYYLSKQLQLPPMVNGIIKSITGIVTLVLNLTLINYLIRRYKVTSVLKNILILTFVILVILLCSINATMFFIFTLLFYIVFLCAIPLQQAFIMENIDEELRGSASGLINSTRAISGVLASLIAGGIYGKLPDIHILYADSNIAYPIMISIICLGISISLIYFISHYIKNISRLS